MTSTDVVELCAQLVRYDTTNYGNGKAVGERAAAEFAAEVLAEASVESRIYESASGRANLVARLEGEDSSLPALLVHGHLDVVPAGSDGWTVPPFSGEVRDGQLWGRGALDMKYFVAATLSVVHAFAASGTCPSRDVVIAFVADEEDRAEFGAQWLARNHASLFDGCGAAISETGAYTFHTPNVHGEDVRLYPVGTAERGTAHLKLTARGRAGHGSRRNDENAVVRLIAALDRLSRHEWPVQLSPTVRALLWRAGDALGIDVDLSDIDGTLKKLGPAAALAENTVRNSTTPTMLDAGYKVNVIPSEAVAQVDTRVLPGSEAQFLSEVDELLGPHIEREFVANQPPVQASVDSPWFTAMTEALRAEDEDAVVVPYCMGGGTDAKAFAPLGIECYGFAPLWVPKGFPYRAMAHGVDERVPVDGIRFGARVLQHFLTHC